MNPVLNYVSDFFSLFFPQVCNCCGKSLVESETIVCTECLFDLPYTGFHLDPDNTLARQLRGRFSFSFAISCFYFRHESKVQHLIHQLKYNNKPETGVWLGNIYGQQIKDSVKSDLPDLIVPVPLHPKRQKQRGYNQSECIARGLSEVLEIPFRSEILRRAANTETQTKKSRFLRFENMKEVFEVVNTEEVAGKHILVVDDVITTGATIESCALQLLACREVRISIASIAFAG